jgi:hypothetical protein
MVWSNRFIVVVVFLAVSTGCGERRNGDDAIMSKQSTDKAESCTVALHALAEGRLVDFKGLPDGCSRSAVARGLGPSTYDQDSHGPAGPFREYAATRFAPHGIVVFFRGDRDAARFVRIEEPTLGATLEVTLGPPERMEDSTLSGVLRQWIYASRGLTIHAPADGVRLRRIYAYPAMTVDEFLASDMSRPEVRRTPMP